MSSWQRQEQQLQLGRFLARKEADESVFTTVTGRSQPAATMIPTRNRYEVPGGSERNLEGGEEQDNQQSQPVASDKATKRRYVAPVYVKQGARRLNDLLSEVKDLSEAGKFRITSVGQGQVRLTADTMLVRDKIREVLREKEVEHVTFFSKEDAVPGCTVGPGWICRK